ncbi:hypothetical protein HID58_066091 [Brassica napus]|uniref:Uncharacterized protein n=1 Tax=Brassica napus TaxID=3708 RepID=A0ABQ7ZEN8_BRANA|nr:hypothetical protein HID58_066091 [Brassica napus]
MGAYPASSEPSLEASSVLQGVAASVFRLASPPMSPFLSIYRLRNSYHGDLRGLDLSCGRDSSGSAVLCFVSACDESYPLRLLMGILLCSARFDGTGVQPYIPLLPSASISPVLKLLASLSRFGFSWSVSPPFGSVLRLEWTAVDVIAGPGPSQPCFAYPPVAVAFGTVRGASDCSPVANPYDLFSCCRFRYQDQEVIY